MSAHLLSLSALHAAAPGVLDIVFGADGDFEGAPRWRCLLHGRPAAVGLKIVGSCYTTFTDISGGKASLLVGPSEWATIEDAALDCRIPSVAARLAGLCNRAMLLGEMDIDDTTADVFSRAMWGTARNWGWRDGHAAFLASLTLSLAPRIAALRSLA